MPFLHSFASMLIRGSGRDSVRVARQIAAKQDRAVATELELASLVATSS
jgi:hypothetical protein